MSIRVARPWLVASGLVLGLVTRPSSALGWVDVHVAGDDVRVDVNKDGSARVEHKITLRVSGGPLKSIDLKGVDADAVPEPDGYVVPGRDAATNSLASAVPVTTEMLPPPSRPREDGQPSPSAMRIRFDADKGLSRGVFVVFVRYRTELFRRGLVQRDGSMARLRWTGLAWEDGFDSARATFVLPAGPTEPRPDEAGVAADPTSESAAPPSVLSTVRRATGRDELELLRPYAPKAEPVTWLVRFDARALDVTTPKAEPTTAASPVPAALAPDRRMFVLLGGGLAFVLYALLVAWKTREVERAARAAGAEPRPLIPAPLFVRATGAGLALVGGLALQLTLSTGTAGALLVALASAFAAFRAPRWIRASSLRGPGTWLPISEEEAFARAARPSAQEGLLDVSTRAGKALFALGLLLLGAAVYFVSATSMYHAELFAYDAVALLALFCTGRLAELPPDPVASAAPLLRDVAKRVRKATKKAGEEVRIVPRIRVPEGSAKADELRLAVVPRSPLPGFSGLEVGVVLTPAAGSTLRSPEVLLRVTTGTACEESVEAIAQQGRSQRGKRPTERAITLVPRLPTAWMTADLVTRLVGLLREGRKASEERSGIRRSAQVVAASEDGRAA
ncbi:hypothetical protein [Polyangium sp. y55x31]|uniref:hypothetical protein n=1 Tax=Polyangium sp. y55x31 TaxID=3042688 RepID=UPI0024828D81|nr:hypothetical protein [Polyangium sp. y55x31]MDI1482026.1 hypothetical protein [Polyangium sp. y55x31]